MPTPPLSDELAQQAVDAYREHGAKGAAARALRLDGKTFRNRLKRASERGMLLDEPPAMPGFRIAKLSQSFDSDGELLREHVQQKPELGEEFEPLPGHLVKGESALVDANGRVLQKWIKTREGQLDPLQVAEWLKEAFVDWSPPLAPELPEPDSVSDDLITILPANDWHVGLHAWSKEVGENWDLKIAESKIGAAAEDTIARSPASAECVVLGGGDLVHADNSSNTTARSGNVLQVDGRYPKVVQTAGRLMVRTIDAALLRHRLVRVRVLPGNHDEHTAVAIAYFLLAWFRDNPRVIVDTDPSLFWWYRFGLCMFGATHGHTVKIAKMPGIMAHRRAEDWGATKFRYVHGFHLHHSEKTATEGDGCICEIHQAPVPQDAWHFGAGFLSGRSFQAITYHRHFGEKGRVRTAIMDAA